MSLEMGKKAIDFFHAHSIDTALPYLAFYGGEPLLNFNMIKQSVAYAKQVFEWRSISFGTTTNGTLLTDEIVDFLVQNNFRLTISLDGPQAIHDQSRVFGANEKGSYNIVVKNIERLMRRHPEYGKKIRINTVINPQNSYDEINSMFEDSKIAALDSLHTIVETENDDSMRPTDTYLNESLYNGFLMLLHLAGEIPEESLTRLSKDEIAGTKKSLEKFERGRLGSIAAPGGPCIPGKNKLFVDCSGNFYPCERVSEGSECMRIGSLDTGLDMRQADALLNIARLTEDQCKNCWAFSHCNICAKQVDENGKLSAAKKLEACKRTKKVVFSNIDTKVALFELNRFRATQARGQRV